MTWCKSFSTDDVPAEGNPASSASPVTDEPQPVAAATRTCPSCGHKIQYDAQVLLASKIFALVAAAIQDLPGLPAGVKFDPTDPELLEHLDGKARPDSQKLHPLIDEFIPTIQGENGICYTHPERLPGVSRDGLIRHFFHRPSKAYTTGTRKRRKIHTDVHGGETRWHKTGKTRPVFIDGKVKGYKKILVLYTNYGKLRKPEKTNWVMHQYHLGSDEEEKDGELVVSKVFFQTQPRQCGSTIKDVIPTKPKDLHRDDELIDYYNSSLITYKQGGHNGSSSSHLIPNYDVHASGSSFLH